MIEKTLLYSFCHFHSLHRHLDISRGIAGELKAVAKLAKLAAELEPGTFSFLMQVANP